MPIVRYTTIRSTLTALALTCLFGCLNSAQATTLGDYQHRISAAAALLEEARRAGDDETNLQSDQVISVNLARVREMLPAKETILVDGQPQSVDNSWLHTELATFEHTSGRAANTESLARIAERLRAISESLSELTRGQARTADKEAEKGRLAEILRRPEYIQVAPEASAAQQLLARFLRWLARLFPRVKPMQPGGSGVTSTIAQILVVGLCVATIALLIWRYGPRFMQGRRRKKTKREARIVLGERLEPDQTAADLLAQADVLARNGDLRSAIRKGYIALLCELGDRKLISLAQHKTNRDYLYSVQDKISLYSSMRKLTTRFELHWYGLVPAAENDWNDFRSDYQKTLRTGSG